VKRAQAWLRALACATAVAVPCGAAAAGPTLLDFSPAEVALILSHGPWPPPTALDAGNAQAGRPETIALGQRLFFDARLAGDGRMSCASCHVPTLAFADGRSRAIARAGPGSATLDRATLDRNTPSLWNAVHDRWYGWDGAADSLWSQSLRALLDAREMASSPAQVAAVVAGDAELACRYRRVFGSPPGADPELTLVNVGKALGAFSGSLVSGRTEFDRFRAALARGDRHSAAHYPIAAQRGLRLFIGRAQCNLCHVGPTFSNGEFGDIGLPFFVRPGEVDAGRHGGITALRASPYNLLSRWSDANDEQTVRKTRQVTAQHRNFGEFKVPGLRNVEFTAPYMHDGQLATLELVIAHYSELNLDRLHADGVQLLQPLRLSAAESAELLAFLRTLSDPQAAAWKPGGSAPCRQ